MGPKSAVLLLALFSACRAQSRDQVAAGMASDEWRRTYTLEKDAEFSLNNRNGAIEVQGANATTVDVRASRVVHAASQKTADTLLSKIEIVDEITPARVTVRTKGVEGIVVGADYDVTYHVTVPVGTNLRLQTSTGDIKASGLTGRVVASSGNGAIRASKLGGGVELRSANGPVEAEVAEVGRDPISLRTTNGQVTLVVPASADANLQASTVNGTISVTGVPFETTGDPGPERVRGRRTRGRLNQGGTSIDLQTVNGNVTVSGRAP